jgi:hypothetical protein
MSTKKIRKLLFLWEGLGEADPPPMGEGIMDFSFMHYI